MAETKPDIKPNPVEINFQVMPKGGKSGMFQPPTPSAPAPVPHAAANDATGSPGLANTEARPRRSGVLIYVIIGLIVLLVLGGLAYYFLGFNTPKPVETTTQSKVSKPWLSEFFQTETCTDTATCGDDADPDKDGLTNYKEFLAGTKPTINDTDGDGLADGDEINIYRTLPLQKYTDSRDIAKQNDYNDGSTIKNGYDPLTPGQRLSDTRLTQIQANIVTYSLHEPTLTTLNNPVGSTTSSQGTQKTSAKTLRVNILGNVMPNATINVGDTVVWVNKDVALHHVASDPHPTHTDLPGLESADLSQGQTYTFLFTKVGIFGYHDHLNPQLKGTITVK